MTILALHGFLGSKRDWQFLSQSFGSKNVISIDLPGHGQNREISAAFSFESVNTLILNTLSKHDLKSVTLVGYSMGGRLALNFALKHPETVSNLIIESATPGIEDEAERNERLTFDTKWALRFETEPIETVVKDWYNNPIWLSLRQHPQFNDIRLARYKNHGPAVAAALRHLGTGIQKNLWPHLEKLPLPMTYISGEYDKKYVEMGHMLSQKNPNIIHHTIPKAGHNTHVEKQDFFLKIVSKQLSQA